MKHSLRKRLLAILMGTLCIGWTITIVTSYLEMSHEVEELFDAQLAQSARVLLSISGHELKEQMLFGPETRITDDSNIYATDVEGDGVDFLGHIYEHKVAFQIWLNTELLAARSSSAPDTPLSPQDNGFSNRMINDKHWRIFSLHNPGSAMTIQVGESYEIREELTTAIALKMLLPLLFTLPVLAVLIWYGIGRAMRPMEQLASQVSERRADHLQPIADDQVPTEVKPLVDSMNTLFVRLQHAFEYERRFTADAAHELRTPLAALKIQAQVAQRATDQAQQQAALEQVVRGVDRATHLVTQLLTLARLEPATAPLETARVELGEVATQVITEQLHLAQEKNIELQLLHEGSHTIQGNQHALEILLSNLVQNALHYTPPGGRVDIAIDESPQGTLLRVMDSGPGIPQQEREKVFQRFYRLLEQQSPGSGLGLSIVGRIAELHHATIALDSSPLGGLEVRVCFPSIHTG